MSRVVAPDGARADDIGTVNGHDVSPADWLEREFGHIAAGEIRTLPFFRPTIPVRACGFTLFERQWLGCLLTPWMLSLLILPGPGQAWPIRRPGDRLALRLPCGNVGFMVGETAPLRQYLACSLMSPLAAALNAAQAVSLAEHGARRALSLPLSDADAPRCGERRAWLGRLTESRHA
ncbi:hydrogenase-2 assembly chaperone [Martelella alba]|uniref:Hydrogenase-2 assembly chaperone n=1 Tax=Martelella alba TaxID=2590451 RepID=A0ABY2SL77_9HYPH|nr:hydrogenase-2 assembly chaperone [Martelella alba]TKI06482.1 hydrogenase-2 assembly chaperone [Martelella alba]